MVNFVEDIKSSIPNAEKELFDKDTKFVLDFVLLTRHSVENISSNIPTSTDNVTSASIEAKLPEQQDRNVRKMVDQVITIMQLNYMMNVCTALIIILDKLVSSWWNYIF